MVCLYYPPGDTDPQVLDVAVDAVCRLSERPDLVVLYELDAAGIHGRDGTHPPTQMRPGRACWRACRGRWTDMASSVWERRPRRESSAPGIRPEGGPPTGGA